MLMRIFLFVLLLCSTAISQETFYSTNGYSVQAFVEGTEYDNNTRTNYVILRKLNNDIIRVDQNKLTSESKSLVSKVLSNNKRIRQEKEKQQQEKDYQLAIERRKKELEKEQQNRQKAVDELMEFAKTAPKSPGVQNIINKIKREPTPEEWDKWNLAIKHNMLNAAYNQEDVANAFIVMVNGIRVTIHPLLAPDVRRDKEYRDLIMRLSLQTNMTFLLSGYYGTPGSIPNDPYERELAMSAAGNIVEFNGKEWKTYKEMWEDFKRLWASK